MFQGLACLERAIKNNVEATGVASCCISRFRDGSPVPAHLVSAARHPRHCGEGPRSALCRQRRFCVAAAGPRAGYACSARLPGRRAAARSQRAGAEGSACSQHKQVRWPKALTVVLQAFRGTKSECHLLRVSICTPSCINQNGFPTEVVLGPPGPFPAAQLHLSSLSSLPPCILLPEATSLVSSRGGIPSFSGSLQRPCMLWPRGSPASPSDEDISLFKASFMLGP